MLGAIFLARGKKDLHQHGATWHDASLTSRRLGPGPIYKQFSSPSHHRLKSRISNYDVADRTPPPPIAPFNDVEKERRCWDEHTFTLRLRTHSTSTELDHDNPEVISTKHFSRTARRLDSSYWASHSRRDV